MDSGVLSVCFRGQFAIRIVVGFLRKNLFEKCAMRWNLLFKCNTFSCWLVLLSFLYIELALVCCRNPTMVIVWGLYSRTCYLLFVFYQSAPPVQSPCNLMNREVAQLSNDAVGALRLIPMGNNQNQCCGSELAKWHDICTSEECVDELRQNNADFKLLCHEWFHRVRHHVHVGLFTGEFATVIWRIDSFTVSFRGDIPRRMQTRRTSLSQS